MRSKVTRSLQPAAHRAATIVVVLAALGGVFGCAIGSLYWGIAGLITGLVGSWALFLVGLLGLHRRETRLQKVVVSEESAPEQSCLPASDFS